MSIRKLHKVLDQFLCKLPNTRKYHPAATVAGWAKKEKDPRRPVDLSSQLIFGWVVAKPTHLAVTPLELRAEAFRSLILNEKVVRLIHHG